MHRCSMLFGWHKPPATPTPKRPKSLLYIDIFVFRFTKTMLIS